MNIADRIRNSNIQVHNREASIYDAAHPEIFGRFEQQRIVKDIDLIASLMATRSCVRALDIGCGTGNLALKFLDRGYQVRAVDISPQMIEVLRSKVESTALDRIEFIVSDAADTSPTLALMGRGMLLPLALCYITSPITRVFYHSA